MSGNTREDRSAAAAEKDADAVMKTLKLTDDVQLALEAVRRAEATYLPGGQSAAIIEIPLLALARAVLAAYAAQDVRSTDRQEKLANLPRALPVGVAEVSRQPKRRRA